MLDNSLQFENIAESRDVSDSHYSKYGVKIWGIDLVETYLPTLIVGASADYRFGESQRERYHMNPWLYSFDKFGVTDYWFIILAINSYKSVFDFKDFLVPLLLPNIQQVDKLVTELERQRSVGIR